MIEVNKEYFQTPYYFFIRESDEGYELFFSSSETLLEARKKEEKLNIPKSKFKELRKYISKLKGTQKKTKEMKKEIEELVDADGAFLTSDIPTINPNITPNKTTDQTVVAARITNDPITRGYRTYYGESEIKETDMSKAFGYEETKDMDGKETYEYLKNKMGMSSDDAKQRTIEFGKDPSGTKDKKSKFKKADKFVSRGTLSEIEKQKALKMLEDVVVNKKNDDKDVKRKENKISGILMRNIQSLKMQADKDGVTITELISLIKK